MKLLGDWQLVRRIRETRGGVHWRTANGFLLVELASDIAKAPAKARAFIGEVEAFAAIFRPDIARVVDWTSTEEFTYVVLEVPAGATLRELADRTLVPADIRARIVLDALEAVEAAHANGAVFGDLDAGGVIVSERGQVVVLPTCSGARAAAPEDDVMAVARLAGIQDRPETAASLRSRLRALGAVAERETVGRLVTRALLGSAMPPPRATSQPPERRITGPVPALRPFPQSSADYDEVTPVVPIQLNRPRAISELSPDDLIAVAPSHPDVPVYIEEPPNSRDTERPVVSQPDIVIDLRAALPKKRRRGPLIVLALLCAACAIAAPIFWRDAATWLRTAGVLPQRAPPPALALEQQAPAAQPPPQVSEAQQTTPPAAPTNAATAEPAQPETAQADAAPRKEAPAPAKRRAARRRPAHRTSAPSRESAGAQKALQSNPYRFVPNEL